MAELDWPQKCDGIVVGLTSPGKPKVFIKAGQPINRDRFTRAHEWGHIMIPWHLGDVTLECEITRYDPVGRDAEREANDFASRVLVPDRYLDEVMASTKDTDTWLDALEACEISAHASLLALRRDLTAGFAFLLGQADGKPPVPITSSGTHAPLVANPREIYQEYARNALQSGSRLLRGRKVSWFKYIDTSLPSVPSGESSSDALEAYIARTGELLPDGRRKRNSIHGVVGGKLRDVCQVDIGWMHGVLRYHIELDPAWNHALSDPDFDRFLILRVAELSHRRSTSR